MWRLTSKQLNLRAALEYHNVDVPLLDETVEETPEEVTYHGDSTEWWHRRTESAVGS